MCTGILAVITKCIFGNTTLQRSISYTLVHINGLHTSVIHIWAVQITALQKGMQLTTSTDVTRYTLHRGLLHLKISPPHRRVPKKSDYHEVCMLHATQCSYFNIITKIVSVLQKLFHYNENKKKTLFLGWP
jgi:hypothetical protein